jgi:hypothetical protein
MRPFRTSHYRDGTSSQQLPKNENPFRQPHIHLIPDENGFLILTLTSWAMGYLREGHYSSVLASITGRKK